MADNSSVLDSNYTLLAGVVILFAAAVCLAVALLWLLRHAKQVAEKSASPQSSDESKTLSSEGGEELAKTTSLDRAFQINVDRLRQMAAGRSYQYDVPWALVVGTPGSGKTTLLANIGLKRALATDRSPATQLKLGTSWHFFNEGLAIDVPGVIFLGGAEKTQRERRWHRLLWQLRAVRPQRPLDAVVLVFSVEDLRSQAGGGLSTLALAVRDRLSELQKQIEMRVPIYLLITKCDLLTGFEAFSRELPESLRGQMLGWSNPHSIDLAFSPGWIDEAVFSIGDRIDRLVFEMFATDAGKNDAAQLFILRNELRTLQSALNEFASRIFLETPYAESPLLRGIYLTGNPEGPPPTDALRPDRVVPVRPAFLNDLFARKIYAEKGVATPFPKAFLSKNRLTRVMQVATVAFVIVATIGSSFAYARLNETKQNQLIPLLSILKYQVGTSSSFSGETAFQVIRAMTDLDMAPFRSVFFPQSWIGRIDRLVGDAMVKSFVTVFEGLRLALQAKHTQLLAAVPGRVARCSNVGSREEHLDRISQYQQLDTFVTELDLWNRQVARFDRLVTPGSGQPDELKQLALYLNPALLQQDVDFRNNQYFQRALSRASDRRFHAYDPAGTTKAVKELSSCFFTAWFGGNVILTDTDDISRQLGDLQSGGMNFDGLGNLSQTIAATSVLLENPEFQWAAKEHFDASDFPVFENAVLRSNAVDFPELTKHINRAGDEAFQTFRSALAETTSPGIGTVVEGGTNSLVLSDEVLALGAFVGKMEQQPFAAHIPEGKLPARPLGRWINWNPEALSSASQLFRAFSSFNFGGLPAVFRSPVQAIAASRTEGNMLDIIAGAQSFQSGTVESSAKDSALEQAKNLSTAAAPLTQLFQEFSHNGFSSGRTILASVVSDQANQLLTSIDKSELALNPYEVRDSTFQWWNGESPVSPLAYGATTPEGVKTAVEAQTAALRELAQAAAPALDLLRVSNSMSTVPAHASRVNWAEVMEDFNKLDGKKANSISSLETYLLAGLDKVNPERSCTDSSTITPPGDPNDLFSSIQGKIRKQITTRCRELAGDGYAKIAADFQEHLAGRFPFSDPRADASAPEAEVTDVAEFFETFDRYHSAAREALKTAGTFNPVQAKQLAFLEQIAAIRPLFSNLLAGSSKNNAPSYDLQVHFRTNRNAEVQGDQVIDWELDVAAQSLVPGSKANSASWHIGDPTRLSLRFAKNSPLRPVSDRRVSGQVVDNRTVSFEYADPWSIFRLVQLHKSELFPAAPGTPGASTLSFYIPTAPDPAILQDGNRAFGGQVRVFMQVAITPSGAKESLCFPEFPTEAPSNVSAPVTSAFNR